VTAVEKRRVKGGISSLSTKGGGSGKQKKRGPRPCRPELRWGKEPLAVDRKHNKTKGLLAPVK